DVLDVAAVDEQLHIPSFFILPYSSATGFLNSPTPSTLTVTTSPCLSGPTPGGVPVEMMSPGSRVMTKVMYSTRCSSGKISSRVLEPWRRSPLTHPSTLRPLPSKPVAMQRPMGPTVSKLLQR